MAVKTDAREDVIAIAIFGDSEDSDAREDVIVSHIW